MMYDLIIIGAGPAGLSAAIYAARQKLNFIVLTGNIGGQTNWSTEVENYLGFHLMTGAELVSKFKEHLKNYKININQNEFVNKIKKKNKSFLVFTKKTSYEAKSVIIATGKKPRHLIIPGEKELYGKGITYCATCDAPLYKNKIATIIGGGNSAVEAAMILVKYAKKINMIVLEKKVRAEPALLDKLKAIKKLNIITNAKTTEILGDKKVIGIKFEQNSKIKSLKTDGVFIEVGLSPNTDFCTNLVKLNKNKEIIVNTEMHSSVQGIFAAGDVNNLIEKQIIIAAGEGCVALLQAVRYIQKLK
ncbi:FAD-dependent oxidoreductase [Candidatus Woesearchaeota archaeon]|nr:FAD-dependent oxidoreductase [Candidatus Woesearchaeota archaeon]